MSQEKMSARWVDRVPLPKSGREEHFDVNTPGLGLRVSFTGKKIWFAQYRVRGERRVRKLTLGPYPSMAYGTAREEAQKALQAAKKGSDPATEKQEEKQAPTFKALALNYLERHAKVKKKSWREDERVINHDLLQRWGSKKAAEIRKLDVIRLLDEIFERKAPIQANRVLALVRKIYNFGIGRDLVDTNPCLQVKRVSPERQRDRVLTEEEIKEVWEAFSKQDPIIGGMFKLRLITAQRGAEVQSMRWEDLDLVNAWWTIPPTVSKNKRSHRVPLTAPALAILKNLKMQKRSGTGLWVFPSPTRKGKPMANVQKAAKRVRDLSGVSFVLHDLRRTAATQMASMGTYRLVVGMVLNHAEPGVTAVYDRHGYDKEKRDALDAWASKLMEIVG